MNHASTCEIDNASFILDKHFASAIVTEASVPYTRSPSTVYNAAFRPNSSPYFLNLWDSHLFDEDAPFGWFTVSFGMVMVVWEYIVSMKFSEMDSMLAYCVDETRNMVLYRELQAAKVLALHHVS